MDRPYEAFKGLASLLAPGGYLLLSVPYLANPIHGHLVHSWTTTAVEMYAKAAGLEVVTLQKYGNAMTVVGILMELCKDDFTEEELMFKDSDIYAGVYATLRKPV